MKRSPSLFLLFCLAMPVIILTFSNILANILFHFILHFEDSGSFLGIAGSHWHSLATSLFALLIWLALNKTWLKIPVDWQPTGKLRQLGYLLPLVIVLVGDSTLDAHFHFTPATILIALSLGLVTGILEEFIFRGLLINQLKTLRFSSLLIALLSGTVFGLVHLVNALDGSVLNTIAQVLAAFSLGFFFAVIYLVTNNLWLPILGHAIIDSFDQLAFNTLSNTSGTSLVTGIIYTIAFLVIGLLIWQKKLHDPKEKVFRHPVPQPKATEPLDKHPLTIDKKKLIIAILIPILELTIGGSVVKSIPSTLGKVLFTDLIFFIGFLIALYLYKEVLKQDWLRFKQHLSRNLLLALLGVIASYVILSLVRSGLKPFSTAAVGQLDMLSIAVATPGISLLASLTALMAPFTEEIIFRHALFYQWKNRGIVTWLMFLLSAILFGLVHWNNFHGDIVQMIPYMFVGAWFALIYYKAQNIWQAIMTHFFFDFLQVLAAAVMLIVSLI